MTRRLWTGLVIAGLLVSALAVGCGATPAPTQAPQPTEEKTAETDTKISITDALGRTVELDAPPERIMTAGRGVFMIPNMMYTFPEAPEKFVAIEKRNDPRTAEFLSVIDPTYDDKTSIEQGAGPEQIAPLKPDLVILKSYMEGELGKPLEELGIPVVYLELETPEKFFDDVRTAGQIFDNEQRAEEVIAFYRERLDRIEKAVGGLGDAEKPNVLVISYSDTGGEVAFKVSPPGWMQATQVEMAGGMPVWLDAGGGDNWTVVGFEQIAAWDPDYVFVLAYRMDPVEVAEKLKADSKWAALRCVSEGHLYGFPTDAYSWDMPDTRWILGVTWLAHMLHPDRLQVDMVQEYTDFLKELYGMDDAAIREHMIPTLQGVGSD